MEKTTQDIAKNILEQQELRTEYYDNDKSEKGLEVDMEIVSLAVDLAEAVIESDSSSIYNIYQCNMHFENSSKVHFGTFSSKDYSLNKVQEILFNGFEELYSGFKDDCYSNGTNQWVTDKHGFGVMIEEVEINEFGEI